MSLECLKTQERNPFTKKCVGKCKRGTKRNRNKEKKKFVCFKLCKKGSVRNKMTNRCKKKKTKKKGVSYEQELPSSDFTDLSYYTAPEYPSDLSYYTARESPSVTQELLASDNKKSFSSSHPRSGLSLKYFHDNSPDFTFTNMMRKKRSPTNTSSLEYYYKTSPKYDNVNVMRKIRSPSKSSQSLDYLYDDKPEFANMLMSSASTPSKSSQSLEYLYDDNPDFANYNELRRI